MLEIYGDAWDIYKTGKYKYLAITTNGATRNDGACVMGRGIASEAKERFPKFPYVLGKSIRLNGNIVVKFENPKKGINLIAFPVKSIWNKPASITLIKRSCLQLMEMLEDDETVLLPRPGCGNGNLNWEDVKKIIEPLLDDRITIVSF